MGVRQYRSKQKQALDLYCKSYDGCVPEYRFHPTRRWRFDWAWPKVLVAVEYEGLLNTPKSRHTTVQGFSNDCEKYNAAALLGWRVIRITALHVKDGIAFDWITEALKGKQLRERA